MTHPNNFVHVQSVLPVDDIIALKKKTKRSSIDRAISAAVYHFIKCKEKRVRSSAPEIQRVS